MGISKLQRMINDLCLCEEVKVEKTSLIIDGAALYYCLYYNSDPKLDQRCGGDYPGFKDEVCNFFKTLKDCEVTPYVFLDGGSGSEKHETLQQRLKTKLKNAKTVAESKPDAVPKGCNVLPPLVKDVFIEILKENRIEFKQCLGEADPEVFSAANQKQCPVLATDTDFCIYDVHKGFLHLDNFEWKSKEDGKIPAKLYARSKFCEHFKLDPALMPVFASVAGNDYSRLEDKGRFARESSSSVSSDEQEQLQLQCLHKAPEGLRRRVFEEALQVQTSALENIPDQLKLPVCVTVFWFKNLQSAPKPETVHCLHALLLGFVFNPNSPEDEFERKMKTLKDEGVSNWQPRVAHAFSQWQCCMRQSLHLNQLLCSPLPEPQCARLYCGPLLHWLADEDTIKELQKTLRGEKKELYENLKTACNPSSGEGSSQSLMSAAPSNEKGSSREEEQRDLKQKKTDY
ncbi:protein asteroid homolog 1-like [Pelmatolapia mariae]|uniref:protein asteroid homolog 1-like n=1 Tax=Pelmatolapia mariae TaxID=158779 RepID=UPI002FE508D9